MASKSLHKLVLWRDRILFVLTFFLFCPIYKIGKNKNIVGFATESFAGNVKYLYREMENYKGIKIFFVTKHKKELERLKSSNVDAYYYMDIKKIPLFLRTDVWVTNHGPYCIPFVGPTRGIFMKLFGVPYIWKHGCKWVDVWHSIRGNHREISNLWGGRAYALKNYDIGFVTSEFLKQRILRFSGANISDKLRVKGFPRTDPLIKKNINKEEISKFIGLPSNRRNILYAPSGMGGRRKKPFFPWGKIDEIIDDIGKFCERNNCNFLIRMHGDWERHEVEQRKKMEEHIKLSKNIFNVPMGMYPDTELILYISDVLITDWSTISNDFILLQRPIIFLVPVHAHAHAAHAVGYNVRNKAEFFEKLRESLDSPKLFEEERKKFVREIYDCLDGNSAKRCAQEIIRLLQENT